MRYVCVLWFLWHVCPTKVLGISRPNMFGLGISSQCFLFSPRLYVHVILSLSLYLCLYIYICNIYIRICNIYNMCIYICIYMYIFDYIYTCISSHLSCSVNWYLCRSLQKIMFFSTKKTESRRQGNWCSWSLGVSLGWEPLHVWDGRTSKPHFDACGN